MSTTIETITDWKSEFEISDQGEVTASYRGVARLCGVEHTTISRLIKTLTKEGGALNLSEPLQPFAGQTFESGAKIPDLLASAVVAHYAFKGINQAQRIVLAMNAIGLRTYLQRELGWQQPQVTSKAVEIEQLDKRITTIEQHLTKPQHKTLPKASIDPIPGEMQALTERQCITRLIRNYVNRWNTTQIGEKKTEQQITQWMYRELKYRYQFDAYARLKKSECKSKIELIEAEGYLPQLHAICNHFLTT